MAERRTVDDAMEVGVQQTPAEARQEGNEATALVASLDIRPKDIMESAANTVRPPVSSHQVGKRSSWLCRFKVLSISVQPPHSDWMQ